MQEGLEVLFLIIHYVCDLSCSGAEVLHDAPLRGGAASIPEPSAPRPKRLQFICELQASYTQD